MTLTTYTIDRRDRILSVSDSWDAFARENDGAAACAAHVVGAPLFDSIEGDPVRMFMSAILMRVRASGAAESVPYRCDSDTIRRLYRMRLEPLADGAVRITHELEDSEASPHRVRIRTAARGTRAVPRCSICNRVKEAGLWRDPFHDRRDRDFHVIHAVCPDCRQASTTRRAKTGPRAIFGAELLTRSAPAATDQ
jgi:hypothetical protein